MGMATTGQATISIQSASRPITPCDHGAPCGRRRWQRQQSRPARQTEEDGKTVLCPQISGCWNVCGAGGTMRRGDAIRRAGVVAAVLGRGFRRQATPTCAWCFGSDRRTTRRGTLPKAEWPMGVRGWFAPTSEICPRTPRFHACRPPEEKGESTVNGW